MILKSVRAIALVSIMALLALPMYAQEINRTFDVTSGSRLELDLETGGDVTIIGWDQNKVNVVALIEGRDAADIVIDMEQSAAGVEVSSESKRRRTVADVDLTIHVPRKFNLEIATAGGDVRIENVDGKIEGTSMGGDIDLTRLAGKVDFSTMGGDIKLTNSVVDGSLHTMGGDVDIEDVTGTVAGTTMGGDVTYNNVKSGKGNSTDVVKISTMGGDVDVDEALYGAELNTMGGKISVRKAGNFVKATTMGGDVKVDAIDGWIEANTMGGDMTVTMIGGVDGDRHVNLESMGGTITLTVPASLSMEFDIEIKMPRDYRDGRYTIKSDFDMDVSSDASGKRDSGVVKGTGSVAGGRNKVKIRTTGGDVIIQKGK